MTDKQYALCEDGYIRCANCEAIKGDEHAKECTGGSLLVPPLPSSFAVGRRNVSDLVERLLALQGMCEWEDQRELIREAAARISELEAECTRLMRLLAAAGQELAEARAATPAKE